MPDRVAIVQRGVDRRLRPRTREVREDAFGTAELIQIIVNECYVQSCKFVPLGSTSAIVGLPRYVRATR